MDLRIFNNPEVVLSPEVRIRTSEPGLARFRRRRFHGKRASKKVERCRKRALAAENSFSEVFYKTGRHENQKTGSLVVFGLQNIRSLNNKAEDVLKSLATFKIDAFFLTETWHDAESTCISRLRQDGFTVLEKARPRNCTTLLTNHGGVAVVVNSRLHASPINVSFKCHF